MLQEIVTRLMSGLLAFPLFLAWAWIIGGVLRIENYVPQVWRQSFSYLNIGIGVLLALLTARFFLAAYDREHWQTARWDVFGVRLVADTGIMIVAAWLLYWPARAFYVAAINPRAFTGWLGGLDAISVLPFAAGLAGFLALALLLWRRLGRRASS